MRRRLAIESRKEGSGVTIYALKGRFASDDTTEFSVLLESEIADQTPALLFDCSKLEQLNSSAIGLLVAAQMKMKQYGGLLALCSPTRSVGEILKLTGVGVVIATFETRQEGIDFFLDTLDLLDKSNLS